MRQFITRSHTYHLTNGHNPTITDLLPTDTGLRLKAANALRRFRANTGRSGVPCEGTIREYFATLRFVNRFVSH